MVKVAARWLAVLTLVGCGGESTRSVENAGGDGAGAKDGSGGAGVSANGATSANAGTPTAAAQGGTGGTAAAAGTGGAVASATGGASGAVSATGGGTVIDGGVADCNTSWLYCCDRSTGAWVPSDCDASGISSCPSDTTKIEPGGVCTPAGYEVTSCGDLQGQMCPGQQFQCHNAQRCSWFCNCQASRDSGELAWRCSMNLC